MKKINVTKRDLVLGAALVILSFTLAYFSFMGVDTGYAYTDEEIMDMYIDQVYGEEYSGILLDEYCDDVNIVFGVLNSEGDSEYWSTTRRSYMVQRIERGY